MLRSEEVRGPLRKPLLAFLRVRWRHGNHIDRSSGGVFARWRGLGVLSLARLARSQDERLVTLLFPFCGVYEGLEYGDRSPNPL
jgi:hypothetical protein